MPAQSDRSSPRRSAQACRGCCGHRLSPKRSPIPQLRTPLTIAATLWAWSALLLAPPGAAVVPARRAAATTRGAAPTTYTNPGWDRDFPDPFVLRVGRRFYAYATATPPYGFQVMESPDMVHWTHRGTAFEPPWAKWDYWAPEVARYRDRFYMTYSARNPATNKHDIGIAVSTSPTGPFPKGVYHLLYSAGWFQSNKLDACYAVVDATSRSPRGPYAKSAEPVVSTVVGKVYGPGHQCVVTLGSGDTWLACHGWDDRSEPRYGSNPAGRTLRIDRLLWRGDQPYVDGPSTDARPAPRLR